MTPERDGLRATPQRAEGTARPRDFASFRAPRRELLSASPGSARNGEGAAGGPTEERLDGTPEEKVKAAGETENAADETAAWAGRRWTAATGVSAAALTPTSAAAFVADAAEMSPTMSRRATAPRRPSESTSTTTRTPDRDRSAPNDPSQLPICLRRGHGLETTGRSGVTSASACATAALARPMMARRMPCGCRSTTSPAAGVAVSPRLMMLLMHLLAAMLLVSPPCAQLRPMTVSGLVLQGKAGGSGGSSSMKGTRVSSKRLDAAVIHSSSGSNSSSGGGGGGSSTSNGVGSSSSSSISNRSISSGSSSRNDNSVSLAAGAGSSTPQAVSSTAPAAGYGKARPQGSAAPTPPPMCDIFTGRWVRDFARPAYTLKDCPQLYSIARTTYCINKKKPRNPSWMFWSWESTSCQRKPRFNATDFLEFMRNKTLAFIGDSLLTADFFPSLLCQISADGHNLRRRNNAHWNKRGGMWTIDSYNVSFITVFSPFLVAYKTDPQLLRQLGARNPEPSKDGSGGDRAISLRKPDSAWSFDLSRFDVAVFQSAAHWNPSTKWRGLIYTDGLWRRLEKQPTVEEAYARAMALVINLFSGNNSRGNSSSSGATKLPVPYLLSPPPRIDNCQNLTRPSTPAQARQVLMNGGGPVERYGTQLGLVKGTPFRHVDITHLSLFRGDALLSSGQRSGRDCLHSCLPGLPDSWVDLFYEVVKNDPALQPTAAAAAPSSGSGSSGDGGSGGSVVSQGSRPGMGGKATGPFVPAIDFDYPSIVW